MNLIKKFEYKIWKHLDKKYKRATSLDCDGQILLSKISQELSNLSRLLILKEISPNILQNLITPIEIPTNERGEEFYKYLLNNKQMGKSDLSYVADWINKEYISLFSSLSSYQSDVINMKSIFDNIISQISRNKYSSISLYPYLIDKLLITSDPLKYAKKFCDHYIGTSAFVNNCSPTLWLRIAAFYLLNEEQNTAYDLILKYLRKHPIKLVHKCLPIADMCYLDGMKEFSKESYVFQNIYNNTKKNLLCEYISNSKVALVGNAPHVDNGGYRKKIDSYPTVIRMNSYNLSEDYIKKFGSKTTIWYRWNGEKKEEKDLNKGNPKLSFLGCSPYTFLYESYLVDRYKDELNHGHIITAIKPQEHQEICKNLDMLYPSGGLILIYLIKKYNSKFSADDCYGFSFKQDNCSEWKHFNNYTEKMPVHNLLLEKEKICTLLKNK